MEVNGTLVDKRICDCDTCRTFFLPASGKHKENDFVAHHICLRHVVEYYQSKLKERNNTLERVWLFTDRCPGQYACRQNYCEVSHFPLKEMFQDVHLVHVRSLTVCSRHAVHDAAHSHLYLSALRLLQRRATLRACGMAVGRIRRTSSAGLRRRERYQTARRGG